MSTLCYTAGRKSAQDAAKEMARQCVCGIFNPARAAKLLEQVIGNSNGADNIWGLRRRGIQIMLYRLEKETGLPCNPHTFRRTFASNLHRSGLDVEHIMRLGGWESLDMVLRYTRSVKFEESLRLYQAIKSTV